MKIEVKPGTEQAVLKRALWLAFSASVPMGLGHLNARTADGLTEDSLWQKFTEGGLPKGAPLSVDYIAGRMVKLYDLSWDDGIVIVRDEDWPPHPDYQSWCVTYPTYEALIKQAREDVA